MFDPILRRVIDPVLRPLGRQLAARHVSANAVTLLGFAIGVAAVPALAWQQYTLALVLILANRLCDGLDGAIARQRGLSDFGGFLDIVLDFVFYALVPFGFLLGQPDTAPFAAFLIVSFFGTGSSFLAFAVLAAKRGIDTERRGRKSFYYLGGLAEGTETVIAFVAICLFPSWFVPIAIVFSAMCWITTLVRILEVRRALDR
ncbi:MAG: CDP-alcohol phosphatidyltransferase family protein [Azospirillaceae bacterium]